MTLEAIKALFGQLPPYNPSLMTGATALTPQEELVSNRMRIRAWSMVSSQARTLLCCCCKTCWRGRDRLQCWHVYVYEMPVLFRLDLTDTVTFLCTFVCFMCHQDICHLCLHHCHSITFTDCMQLAQSSLICKDTEQVLIGSMEQQYQG